jgi:hypothetical protein
VAADLSTAVTALSYDDMTATLRECRSALLAAHLDALTAATNYPFNLGKTDP